MKSITVRQIKSGDTDAFETVFNAYYAPLLNLANGILRNKSLAEEQVQDVFLKMWESRDSIGDETKIFPYLITCVRNKCYDQIRHNKVRHKYLDHTQKSYQEQILNYNYNDLTDEVIQDLAEAVDQLPEKCKEVFRLSRFDGLSHKEISQRLDISTKTIENHVTKALRFLRNTLKKYNKRSSSEREELQRPTVHKYEKTK